MIFQKLSVVFLVVLLLMFSASGQERATTKKLPPLNEMMQQLEKQSQKKEVEVNKPQLQPQQGIVPVGKKRYSNYVELVKNVSDAVVTVLLFTEKDRVSRKYGSGFFISPNQVITNYHVIKTDKSSNYEPLTASIQKKNGKEFTIKGVVAYDKINDVALLEVEEKGANNVYVPLADKDPDVGEEVVVIGTPADLSLSQTVTTGIVSAKRGVMGISNQIDDKIYGEFIRDALQNKLQISAPITHGSSGSPVFNMSGQVVGIAVSGLGELVNLKDDRGKLHYTNVQNYNGAVPAVYAAQLKPQKLQTISEMNRKESGILMQAEQEFLQKLLEKDRKLLQEDQILLLDLIDQFSRYIKQGECEKGGVVFNKLLPISNEISKLLSKPDDKLLSVLFDEIALCFYSTKQYDKAILALEASIKLNEIPDNCYHLAIVLYYNKQLADKAIELLERAILLDRNFLPAINFLCEIHAERGTTSKYCPEEQQGTPRNQKRPAQKGLPAERDEDEQEQEQIQVPRQVVPQQQQVPKQQQQQTQAPKQVTSQQQQTQVPKQATPQQQQIQAPKQTVTQSQTQIQPLTRQITETRISPSAAEQNNPSSASSSKDSIDSRSVEEIYRNAVRLKSLNLNTEAHREYVLLKAKDEFLACHLYFAILYPRRTKDAKDFYPCEDPTAIKAYFRDEGAPLPAGLYPK